MNKTNLLLLPGDGVGPEIMTEATKVIDALNSSGLCNISIDYGDIGGLSLIHI